jgi:hypothetical protein
MLLVGLGGKIVDYKAEVLEILNMEIKAQINTN